MAEKEELRTSLYLLKRAEALLAVIRFFRQPVATDNQLQFLAQSDYWEWEIDNLLYSFTNLAERAQTWRSSSAAAAKLNALGIVVKSTVVQKARWHHGWRLQHHTQRVAPLDLLQQVVDLWNNLIDDVEARFVTPMQKTATRYNIQTLTSLNHLRKKMPNLAPPATADNARPR